MNASEQSLEASFGRVAAKALAKRRGIPVSLVRPDGRFVSSIWVRIVEAMGPQWMTAEDIAMRAGLTLGQVRSQFGMKPRRQLVELRGSRRNGFEWRLKPKSGG